MKSQMFGRSGKQERNENTNLQHSNELHTETEYNEFQIDSNKFVRNQIINNSNERDFCTRPKCLANPQNRYRHMENSNIVCSV